MSILSQIGTAVGTEFKSLGSRMTIAENAIVALGGQDPPPTGDLVISDVQWKNISEITGSPQYVADPENDGTKGGVGNATQMFPVKIIVLEAFALGDQNIVFPVGTILHGTGLGGTNNTLQRMEDPSDPRDYPYSSANQSTGNWNWVYISDRGTTWDYAKINTIVPTGEAEVTGTNTLTKIGGVDGYNTGGSSTNFIGGESNGYFQFQLSGRMKVGIVYADSDYNVDNPFTLSIFPLGGVVQIHYEYPSLSLPFTDGDWFRIRHYASDNKIHFQRKQEIYSPLPNFALPTSPNNGHSTHYTYAEEDRPLAVSLVTMTLANGHEIIEGQPFKIETLSFSVSNEVSAKLLKLDGTSIGWVGNRASKWEVAEEIGQGYVTEFIHPTLTNGTDLFLDVSLREIGSSVNDPKIAK